MSRFIHTHVLQQVSNKRGILHGYAKLSEVLHVATILICGIQFGVLYFVGYTKLFLHMIIGLIVHFLASLLLEMCLFANRSSSNACIMVLLKLTFVSLWSPFLSRIGKIYGTCVMASVQDLGKCRASRHASYTILCLLPKGLLKCSKWLEAKLSDIVV